MKKMLSVLLTFATILSLCACTQTTPPGNDPIIDPISAAEDAIQAGNYQQAYTLLLESDSEEAAALLSNFFFMPVSYKEEGKKTVTYTYDENGNLLADDTVWEDGTWRKIAFIYDDSGRRMSYTATEDDGDICTVSYTYDDGGKLLTIKHNGTFLIEQHGSIVGITDESAWELISYTYDDAGNILTEEYTYPNGTFEKTSFTYDQNGNMLTQDVTGDANGVFQRQYTYTYDDQGKMQSQRVTYDDGSGPEITYSYSTNGNLIATEEVSSSEKIVTTYNDYGSILTQETIWEHHQYKYTYTYDENNRLLTREENHSDGDWTKWVYTYDDDGNMVEMYGSSSDGGNGTITYTYDEYGNWITRVISNRDRRTTLSWDIFYFPNGVTGRAKEVLEMHQNTNLE